MQEAVISFPVIQKTLKDSESGPSVIELKMQNTNRQTLVSAALKSFVHVSNLLTVLYS